MRDQNTDLMDQFLTRGGRAVPIFLFLNQHFNLIFKWGPRPKIIQDIYEVHRDRIDDGTISKIEIIKKLKPGPKCLKRFQWI